MLPLARISFSLKEAAVFLSSFLVLLKKMSNICWLLTKNEAGGGMAHAFTLSTLEAQTMILIPAWIQSKF